MKPIREVYPGLDEPFYGGGTSDYHSLIESLGHEIVLEVTQQDYSGDSWLLLRSQTSVGPHFGYLEFGWGSCSGCDALQACDTYDELDKLRMSLRDGIRWFPDPAAALDWFRAHDWEGDFSQSEERDRFVREAMAWLANA